MAQPMPESVKIARVGFSHTAPGSTGVSFEVSMAKDEVLILLAIQYWYAAVLGAGVNILELTLFKKTDQQAIPVANSPDILFHVLHRKMFITESYDAGDRDYIILPWPVVLIRPPRLFVRSTTSTAVDGEMRLFYLSRKVKDVDLAKLMVKDHA